MPSYSFKCGCGAVVDSTSYEVNGLICPKCNSRLILTLVSKTPVRNNPSDTKEDKKRGDVR